jgi:uncharacterized protein YeeX (DUF496 family)
VAVVFEAVIKNHDNGTWKIELTDTVSEKMVDCFSVEEFSQKIEELGEDYGGRIDEVKWSSSDDLLPMFLDEVRYQMSEYQKKIEAEKQEN